jgi:hypothetical protein
LPWKFLSYWSVLLLKKLLVMVFECAVSAGKSAKNNLPAHVPEKVLAGVPARLFGDIVRALGPWGPYGATSRTWWSRTRTWG